MKCEFDKEDGCHALVCYCEEKCESRDENGYPKYADDNHNYLKWLKKRGMQGGKGMAIEDIEGG